PVGAHDDIGDFSPSGDQKTELAVELPGELRHLTCQFVGQDLFRGDPAAVELLDPPELFRLQAGDISMNFLNRETSKMVIDFSKNLQS
ncbi:MAG: hypothetical protein JW902_07175, partial [Syntrophaceae bacterium]|nr:hypothetical protein [Syntrophaceae bacterium]